MWGPQTLAKLVHIFPSNHGYLCYLPTIKHSETEVVVTNLAHVWGSHIFLEFLEMEVGIVR